MEPFRAWVMAREYRTKGAARGIALDVLTILSSLPLPSCMDRKELVERAIWEAFALRDRKRVSTVVTSWNIFRRWAREEFDLHLPMVRGK